MASSIHPKTDHPGQEYSSPSDCSISSAASADSAYFGSGSEASAGSSSLKKRARRNISASNSAPKTKRRKDKQSAASDSLTTQLPTQRSSRQRTSRPPNIYDAESSDESSEHLLDEIQGDTGSAVSQAFEPFHQEAQAFVGTHSVEDSQEIEPQFEPRVIPTPDLTADPHTTDQLVPERRRSADEDYEASGGSSNSGRSEDTEEDPTPLVRPRYLVGSEISATGGFCVPAEPGIRIPLGTGGELVLSARGVTYVVHHPSSLTDANAPPFATSPLEVENPSSSGSVPSVVSNGYLSSTELTLRTRADSSPPPYSPPTVPVYSPFTTANSPPPAYHRATLASAPPVENSQTPIGYTAFSEDLQAGIATTSSLTGPRQATVERAPSVRSSEGVIEEASASPESSIFIETPRPRPPGSQDTVVSQLSKKRGVQRRILLEILNLSSLNRPKKEDIAERSPDFLYQQQRHQEHGVNRLGRHIQARWVLSKRIVSSRLRAI